MASGFGDAPYYRGLNKYLYCLEGSNCSHQRENIGQPQSPTRRLITSPRRHLPSPTWHRRLRKRRSQARRAVRQGQVLTGNRLHRLVAHHATCPARRQFLLGMGRGGKQAQQTWGEERPYRIWHGAYSPSAQRPRAPWKTGQSAVFPAYNAIDLTKDVPTGHSAGEADTAGAATASGLVPTLQAALNTARKAEQRVMKLKQARSTGATKWQQYEASLKAAFARERDTLHQRPGAACQGNHGSGSPTGGRQGISSGCFHAWSGPCPRGRDLPSVDQVFAGWAQEERTDYGAVLQRAMEIGPGLATTPLRPTAAVPRTPLPTYDARRGLASASADCMISPGPAVTDPYTQAAYLQGTLPAGFSPMMGPGGVGFFPGLATPISQMTSAPPGFGSSPAPVPSAPVMGGVAADTGAPVPRSQATELAQLTGPAPPSATSSTGDVPSSHFGAEGRGGPCPRAGHEASQHHRGRHRRRGRIGSWWHRLNAGRSQLVAASPWKVRLRLCPDASLRELYQGVHFSCIDADGGAWSSYYPRLKQSDVKREPSVKCCTDFGGYGAGLFAVPWPLPLWV